MDQIDQTAEGSKDRKPIIFCGFATMEYMVSNDIGKGNSLLRRPGNSISIYDSEIIFGIIAAEFGFNLCRERNSRNAF